MPVYVDPTPEELEERWKSSAGATKRVLEVSTTWTLFFCQRKTKKKKTPKNEKLLVVDRTTELPSFDVVLAEKAQNSRIFNEHFEQHTHNDELRLKALQDDLAKESGNYI